jgi:putative membrane protein
MADANDTKIDKTELAEERTEFAEDRTIMAVERTFAGWMRTAFAAIGIGLAFRALFGQLDPPWLARAIATMFIAAAGFLAIAAERRACRTLSRLNSHRVVPASTTIFWVLGWSVALGAGVLIAGLWVVGDDQLSSV